MFPSTADPWPDPEFDGLDPAVDAWINREVAPDEKLVWVGRPRRTGPIRSILPATGQAASSLLFALILTGFILLSARGNAVDPFALAFFGFMVLAVVQSVRMALATLRATRAVYLLTDQRAVIGIPGRRGVMQVESFFPESLGGLIRREDAHGSGDLIFEEFNSIGDGAPRRIQLRGFLRVDHVQAVERLVRLTLLPHPIEA